MKILSVFGVGVVAFLNYAPSQILPKWVDNINAIGLDKAVHCLMFCVLCYATQTVFANSSRFFLLLAGLASAIALEVTQSYFTSRCFEYSDMVANAAGVFMWFFTTCLIRTERKN